MQRHVQGREPLLRDARDVLVLDIRERDEGAGEERQPKVVVAHVQRWPQPGRELRDEAEDARVVALAHAVEEKLVELDADRLVPLPRDDRVAHRALGRRDPHEEAVLGGQPSPVDDVAHGPAVHRQDGVPGAYPRAIRGTAL